MVSPVNIIVNDSGYSLLSIFVATRNSFKIILWNLYLYDLLK